MARIQLIEYWKCPCGARATVLCEGAPGTGAVDFLSRAAAEHAGWLVIGIEGIVPEALRGSVLDRQVKTHWGRWFQTCPAHKGASGTDLYALAQEILR